ncbi:MAG TPA: hypothetical protein GXX24_03875 [Paracoccus solventivorans]|uniref:Uncharacterized protein n=1 Tax=Paracoccus solventivorans TaxID=53463 RepID=A0A832PLS5_9RHOB|nr:hypothetical protein [Paracoccus solventivorans]HHW33266.1 hypothetical protein [Paracoccus solventivorans]
MIDYNIVNCLAFSGLVIWLIYLALWCKDPCLNPDAASLRSLERRLSGYAALKDMRRSRQRRNSGSRGGDNFEVLLGILKKTEAKSLGLSTVWSLAITSLVAAFAIEAFKGYRFTLMCLIIGSLPMICLSLVVGMNHVSQRHYDKIEIETTDVRLVRSRMKKQLMCDLLMKEKALDLASDAAGGFVILMMVLGCMSLSGQFH